MSYPLLPLYIGTKNTRYNNITADTTHSKMGSQYWEHDKYDDTEYSRYAPPTLRWVQSCPELPQEHTLHTRGRYSPITDGSTHAESNNQNIQRTPEAEWQYTIKLMAYTTHSKVGSQLAKLQITQDRYSSITDGSTHAESNYTVSYTHLTLPTNREV